MVTNCDHIQKLKFFKTLPYAFTAGISLHSVV